VAVDAMIDFTVPVASRAYAKLAAERHIAHIIGTTGLSADDLAFIAEQARKTCIIRSGNMSLGVNLLAAMVQKVAAALDPSFDIEIVEMHHRMKIDAPSGTAYLLGEAAAAGRHIALESHSIRSRDGETGKRPEGAIGFATLRGGTVVGDHSVIFAGNGERITLSHHAEDRSLFASGAVKAALWSKNKPVGLYSMMDVLGLS
jgi:4-hydroxy-tetrahydrodipicolinate reductase